MHCWLHILAAAAVVVADDQVRFRQQVGAGLESARGSYQEGNSTGNLIFWSVNSLLQHWPNTRYTNGTVTFCYALLDRVDSVSQGIP